MNGQPTTQPGVEALRRKNRRGNLDPVARDVLNRLEPGWDLPQLELRWERSFIEFKKWCVDNNGFPRQKGADRDEPERRSGDWLRTQKGKALSDERRARLDGEAPGWDVTAADQWMKAKSAAAAWMVANGRLPKITADGAEERRHAVWIRTWKTTLSRRDNPERRAELDRALPGWDAGRAELFHNIATEYATWVETHGRLPAIRVTAGEDERRLAGWLNNTRVRWVGGRLGAEAQQVLDQLVPDWRLTLTERMAARQ